MPCRNVPLVNNNYYHIFNRGVAKNPIFTTKSDYVQAMLSIQYYKHIKPPTKLSRLKEQPKNMQNILLHNLHATNKLVDIISFVLMPNHFHFLLKQNCENGISQFISKFSNSYTKYFNTKYNRIGHLFQGPFKSVFVENDSQLIHLSRYIHLNPVVSYVIRDSELFTYPWSSLPEYVQKIHLISSPNCILSHFNTTHSYQTFLTDHIDYARKLHEIAHLTFENH